MDSTITIAQDETARTELTAEEIDRRILDFLRANESTHLISEILAGAEIDYSLLALRRLMALGKAGQIIRSAPARYCMAD